MTPPTRALAAAALTAALAAVATTACSGVPTTSAPSGSVERPAQTTRSYGADAKPTKEAIVIGLAKFYEQSQDLPTGKAQRFAACMVDKMYDKASIRTLLALRDGNPKDFEPLDTGLIAKSGLDCQSSLN